MVLLIVRLAESRSSVWIQTHLIEIEDQIELAHIVKVLVQYLDEIVYRLQVGQIVIVHIDTNAEIQAGVSSVDNLEVAKLCVDRKEDNQ